MGNSNRASIILFLLAMMMTRIRSLPRYNLPFLLPTHLHRPSPIHHFNFVANGHPYKITVNDKELQPRLPLPTQTPSKPNKSHKNSPITWITNPIGFNGIPVNIVSYPHHQPHSQVNRIWGAPSGLLTYYG